MLNPFPPQGLDGAESNTAYEIRLNQKLNHIINSINNIERLVTNLKVENHDDWKSKFLARLVATENSIVTIQNFIDEVPARKRRKR